MNYKNALQWSQVYSVSKYAGCLFALVCMHESVYIADYPFLRYVAVNALFNRMYIRTCSVALT